MLVTKAMDCHTHYYATAEKKAAALKDDRYVYPGDPVSVSNLPSFIRDMTPTIGHPCKHRPRLPKRPHLRHSQARVL